MPSIKTNWRLIVYPYRNRYSGRLIGDGLDECNRMRGEIQRHIDDVGNIEVAHDAVCAVCDAAWETPPMCCGMAMDGWQTAHPEWTLDENYNWHKSQKES